MVGAELMSPNFRPAAHVQASTCGNHHTPQRDPPPHTHKETAQTPHPHPCRVRNFLKAEGASFLVLSEYVEPADAARARSYFFTRRRPLLLLTERAQFYHRYSIRGIKVWVGVFLEHGVRPGKVGWSGHPCSVWGLHACHPHHSPR